ncbi:MAG: S46 family peptidase [Planctomycetes bacterium]|nr:S46 family peptidase [Planctomycetota bacterium]
MVALAVGLASADEGMWVYNQLPTKLLKDRYGFEPPPGWAEHLMRSSVRFNSGGSGSFVSSTGLVLTNHHVAADTLAKISTAERNYYRDGFLAKTLADEVPAPDLELNQLVEIVDVTDRVNKAVAAEPADKAQAARQAEVSRIEKESTEQTKLRSDVITLYQGGAYHLYRYKKYTDVRLAFAPEFSIAFFGGDADNFEYPRHDLDMALFRVYENGQPAKIEHFLRWSSKGAADGELIFVSGHPARTSRLLTVDALHFQRDVRFPAMVNLLRRREITLQQFAADGEEFARRAKKDLFGVQNSRKRSVGQMQSLHDPRLFDAKKSAETELRFRRTDSPREALAYDPWERIAAANQHHAHLFKRHMLLEMGAGFYSELFAIARSLVRMAAEDNKPNEKRLAEYRDSGRESLKRRVFSPAPIYEDLERAKLTDSLSMLLEELQHEPDVLQKALAGKGPVARAVELVNGTKLKDVEERKRIAAAGWKAIESSTDSMIMLARDIDERARVIRKELETSVEEPERQAYGEIAKLRFAKFGTSVYPDATFTLRLAFGTVKGVDDADTKIPAWTTIAEAFEHEAAHGGQEPWKLPRSWHDHKSKLDLATPLNFAGTADGVGGNSGSPVVNRAGEVVGLIFDSNIPALANEFRHSSDVGGRSISVHSAGMLEAMRKIYDADKLADELGH